MSYAANRHRVWGSLLRCMGGVVLLMAWAPLLRGEVNKAGEKIYKENCARCHGETGGGGKKYSRPLVGEKSIPQLANLIARTMPDDDPETIIGNDAKNVSAYIYETFYSPDAQARISPPTIGLSHLTVRQYRNAVADLIGSFRGFFKTDPRQGLHGEYFAGRDLRKELRAIDRIDPQVKFDFGELAPTPSAGETLPADKPFNPHQFSIRWEGSVLAPETGNYEFIVRTEHALQFFVNDSRKPMIDALVKSGDDKEYRSSIYLVGGRWYSLRLEVYKGRGIGKIDPKNTKDKPKPLVPTPATVEIAWRAPQRAQETIPSRFLMPVRVPELAVIDTPFPPDDRSYGWERGTAVSKEWVSAASDAALEVAGYVAGHIQELSGVQDGDPKRAEKLQAFCATFAERAFHHPLSDTEKKAYVAREFAGTTDYDLAVKRSVLRVMASPALLYPETSGAAAGYAIASRLALILWDSEPDQLLLSAAASGKLKTYEQIAQQAQRMLADPRAKAKMHDFMMAWLRIDQPQELVKDKARFPTFTPAIASDLRTSLEMFVDDVAASDQADFRQLLVSDEMYLNGNLAAYYKVPLPANAPFTKIKMDPQHQRSGVLTHPYLLSLLAYPGESSPIHRGVFMIRGLLGITLRPPQDAAPVPLPPGKHANLTTRERITLQTGQGTCFGCHAVVNPLGFALEQFDAVGQLRLKENGKAIDVTGKYETRMGTIAEFNGARQLAQFLANSDEVQGSFAQQMFQHFVKQPVRAYGLQMPTELTKKFIDGKFNMRKLLVEIAVIASQPPAPASGQASAN